MDRYALAILIQPVKRDLQLSDTQIGWLMGFAFAATYALVGVPVARYADRGRGRRVIAWSGGRLEPDDGQLRLRA